ncbi:MAG: chorismate mutase [Ignisphaera sp.]|nr:chorismate mutase [Ignisphaera sp.]
MEIEELRRHIDEIDRRIIQLVGSRLELVQKIAELKNLKGMGVSDDERELAVKMNWRRLAVEYGVPSDMATALADLLMKYSKSMQINLRIQGEKLQERVVFVGYGGMSRVLAGALVKAGHSVVITGRNLDAAMKLARDLGCSCMDIVSALEFGEYVVLALPPEAFRSGYVDEIARYFRDRIVMDILSSKSWIFNHIENKSLSNNFMYVSTHPLFGPLTTPIGEKIAVIPSRTGGAVLQRVVNLWYSAGLEPIILSLEEHEKAMAIVQVLTHLYLLALSRASEKLSKELGINADRLSTPTYREVRAVLEKLKYMEGVVFEIQKTNPFSALVRERALEALKDVIEYLGRES